MANRLNMRGGRVMTVRAQQLRRQSTDAERALWRLLRQNQLGRRFRRQFPIPPYIVDFICLEAQLIIEADGGQHSLPGDHDRRDAFQASKGWRILRLWNDDILRNREGVFRQIVETLEQNPHPDPPPQAGEGE
jgi:very-short-patch-repair endonuclease